MRFDPALRAARVPAIDYPPDLPVVERREEIAAAIAGHQVVILCGETGSGKTTQLPKICLQLGRGINGFIGHTQPRRIAARTVGQRIADELHTTLGDVVGYKIRFGDHTGPGTLVKLMTDGILLAETQHDRQLRQYDTLIIDEAHERSLNIDFLLGYLRQLLPKRPDLKVIVTSATIDPDRFARHFADAAGRSAPVINVSGRTYPVEVVYRPLRSDDPDEADIDELDGITSALLDLQRDSTGDTLVFLPTERDIRDTADALEKNPGVDAEILPLFSRLAGEQQMKVFRESGRRRVILSTNVAETSVTVPGIRYVIDTGVARISRYAPRTKVQRLPIEPISRASADQRKGRCGRIGPGVCIRLYSQDEFEARPAYTDPEIVRTNLASVILQMMSLGFGDIQSFPFIDPPDYRAVRDGYATLHEIGAIDEQNRLTKLGRHIASLPVDPRLARIIVAGEDEECLDDVLVLASFLSAADPRERPLDKQQQADTAHAQFRDGESDFITILKLWRLLKDKQRELSSNQFRRFAKANFISYARVREWQDVHQQLRDTASDDRRATGRRHHNPRPPSVPVRPRAIIKAAIQGQGEDAFDATQRDAIHRALLAGLLSNVGMKVDGFQYQGPRGIKFGVFPGSVLFKNKPQWVTSAELVETTRLYARTCAPVRPEWVERLAAHLVKRTYNDPQWQQPTANVIAYERVTLWGLILVQRRMVQFGQIDPATSRELFIHHALVHHEFRTDDPALLANRQLVEQVEQWQHKARRHDLLNTPQERYAFYDSRIPPFVWSGPTFDQWRKRGNGSNNAALHMTQANVLRPDVDPITDADYPATLQLSNARVPLRYLYDPGEDADGLTAIVPIQSLADVPDARVEWLAPGYLPVKVEELIRSLPKRLRTRFVPVAETLAKVLKLLPPFGVGSLQEAVAAALWKISGEPITRDDFQPDQLAPWLSMNFRVLDDQGAKLAQGRNLLELRARLGQSIRRSFATYTDPRYTKDDLRTWDFGDLPQRVVFDHHGVTVYGYPTLVEEADKVNLRLLDSPATSARLMRYGLLRLFIQQTQKEITTTLRDLPGDESMRLRYKPFGPGEELGGDLVRLIADRAFFPVPDDVRSKDRFNAHATIAWRSLYETSREMGRVVGDALEQYHAVALLLGREYPPLLRHAADDMRDQLSYLLPRRFLHHVPPGQLVHMPRYLRGIAMRQQKLMNAGLKKDATAQAQVQPLWERWKQKHAANAKRGLVDPAVVEFRWLLEEFRISLFAQELKTAAPVSLKKLETVWQTVRA